MYIKYKQKKKFEKKKTRASSHVFVYCLNTQSIVIFFFLKGKGHILIKWLIDMEASLTNKTRQMTNEASSQHNLINSK